MLEGVGRFAARRAPFVLIAWLVIAIGLVAVANSAGRPENDNVTLPGTGSQSATDLLDKYLPEQANGSVPIVLESSSSLAAGKNKQELDYCVN
jgi:RND superfamily putative drug exporter